MRNHFTLLIIAIGILHPAVCQDGSDCPQGWDSFSGKCWLVTNTIPQLSWSAAESYCNQNNGHLASFANVAEREFAVGKMNQFPDTDWWIGLNDLQNEGTFTWIDNSFYDEEVAKWDFGEPNNIVIENCVEIRIRNQFPNNPGSERWNDDSCAREIPFVCKRDPGTFPVCPSNYQDLGGKCYYVSPYEYTWVEAQNECKNQGANLMSIGTSSEQSIAQNLMSSQGDIWVGLSDTASPNSLAWVDNSQISYQNWASGFPGSPLPYQGSSCTEVNVGLGYKWMVDKCSNERKFICERGYKADCPNGWLYSSASGKCYEFVVNPSRLQTWIFAKELCIGLGGGLLKIESQDEQIFIGGMLEAYTTSGHPLVWIGASDVGHDNQLKWWDEKPIQNYYWNDRMPQYVDGREDCVAVYTGKGINNWETTNCFEPRAYVCELPEGQGLPSAPVITVDGKCDKDGGWRHFINKCYFFGSAEMTQSEAKSFCSGRDSKLASVLNENELSFIVGNIQYKSWMGLEQSGGSFSWIDGSAYSWDNFLPGEPDQSGNCVSTDQLGQWSDESCSLRYDFVCKKDELPTNPSTIPPPTYVPDLEKCGGDGWISDPTSDRCYKVNYDLRNWHDARYACMVGGGDLAAINSPTENDHVLSLIRGNPTDVYFFIGGSDLNNFNVQLLDQGWSWSDGSAFNFINWDSGEPNNSEVEDCMEIFASGNGKWNDKDCYAYQPSICEKRGNMENIVGPDITDTTCESNEACCFKHLGAEYGGTLPNSAMSASSERDQWFTAERGRLNTPADVIIVNGQSVGNGHGGWSPAVSDGSWLQVDFADYSEVKGIITQGRTGIVQYSDRQWVTSFKVAYSQDVAGGKWEFISDADGNPTEFKGNADQNTQVTNMFNRPVIARHIRCYPLTWKENPVMRLEYIGCKTSCLNNLGMNSGLIGSQSIIASSSKAGKGPEQARPPPVAGECITSGSNGADYRGWVAKTVSGIKCQAWSSQSPHKHDYLSSNYPTADLINNYCRNPDGRASAWCFTTDPDVESEACAIPSCPTTNSVGWYPSSSTTNQYIQVQFSEYFKVAGVTLYNVGGSNSYVKTYTLSFSDSGNSFNVYKDQSGNNHIFTGLMSGLSQYTDILREPVSTKNVRLSPQTWYGEIALKFELNGCYANDRITCADTGALWVDEGDHFIVDCPSGCVEDISKGVVWGTNTYTFNSAVCPAAIHAGALVNSNGGQVNIIKTEGLGSYSGSYSHGITSQSLGPYGNSLEFNGKSLRCNDGWVPWKDHCYMLSMTGVKKTWHDARSECIKQGGDLVSILTPGENDFIKAQIYVADLGGDIWIGLNDMEVTNYYQWSDGSPVTMTFWFWDEPKTSGKACVNIYRFEGYWNDKSCDETLPYMCKAEKQLLPPLVTVAPPVDEGCDPGWRAYGSSCYLASDDTYMFIYANRVCEEQGAKLASVHDDYEQSFLHSLVIASLPPGLGYTSWIGLSAEVLESGALYYSWESGEDVSYTHWGPDEPNVNFQCAFPFVYQGITFYECTTYDPPFIAGQIDAPWCSIDPIYSGRWINCGAGYEYGCTYMDDQSGYWKIGICGLDRYYACEKDRVGYTQPAPETTADPRFTCADGWVSNDQLSDCYQINEFADAYSRATWVDALNYCRAQKTDLVSIHSYQEESAIWDLVVDKAVYSGISFWTGLNDNDIEAGYQWTDGTPVSYTNWNTGEPNDHNNNENCMETALTYGSTWNDLNCDASRNWICKISKRRTPDPPPTLPPPLGSVSPECGTDGEWIRYQPLPGIDKCYLFIDDFTHGWALAQQNCTQRGAHLVSIHSPEESVFLLSRASKSNLGSMWIGLRTMNTGDGKTFGWSDNSTVDYKNWGLGEPNDYFGQEDCAELTTDSALWNDDNCGVQTGFICQKYFGDPPIVPPPPVVVTGGCPAGTVLYGNNCWKIGGFNEIDRYNWTYTVDVCGELGMEPATLTNEYEQAFLTTYLPQVGESMWVGLSARIGNIYVWHDQSQLTYTNWYLGEPNGYYGEDTCVELVRDYGGKWVDDPCEHTHAYACYTNRDSSIPISAPPQDPLCLNGYFKSGDSCYKIMDTPMSRSNAMAACQADGVEINLFGIQDSFENSLGMSWLWRDVTVSSVWLGLQYQFETTESGDTTTTFTWDSTWPVTYTNWAAMEPNTDVTSQGSGCVLMNSDGTWTTTTAESCQSMMLPFVCEQHLVDTPPSIPPISSEGKCDPGFVGIGPYCYFIETAQIQDNYRSWYEAVFECENRGATLASFHSEDECLAVVNSLEGGSHNLFIGLSSSGFAGGWKWVDGSGADFFNWVTPGEPNGQGNGEDCVEMYPWDGRWNDVDCYNGRGYICKKPRDNTMCLVDELRRVECGYVGIDNNNCLRRDCCFDETYMDGNFSGCYYKEGYVLTTTTPVDNTKIPPTAETIPDKPKGVSGGAIAGIIIGVIAIVLIGVGVFFYMRSDTKPSLSLPDTSGWFGNSSSQQSKTAGFDNPVVSMQGGIEAEA